MLYGTFGGPFMIDVRASFTAKRKPFISEDAIVVLKYIPVTILAAGTA
jgi:hypothetical protein